MQEETLAGPHATDVAAAALASEADGTMEHGRINAPTGLPAEDGPSSMENAPANAGLSVAIPGAALHDQELMEDIQAMSAPQGGLAAQQQGGDQPTADVPDPDEGPSHQGDTCADPIPEVEAGGGDGATAPDTQPASHSEGIADPALVQAAATQRVLWARVKGFPHWPVMQTSAQPYICIQHLKKGLSNGQHFCSAEDILNCIQEYRWRVFQMRC